MAIANESMSTQRTQKILIERGEAVVDRYVGSNSQAAYYDLILYGHALEEAERGRSPDVASSWVDGAKLLLRKYSRGSERAHFFMEQYSEIHQLDLEDMLITAEPSRLACGLTGIEFAQAVALGAITLDAMSESA